jgi:hypothetical protein
MVKMMPDVTKCSTEWTPEERYHVITHRHEWIQLCLDYYEKEQENKKLLKFLESKNNATF